MPTASRRITDAVSVVFQDPATALNPRMYVPDQLADPLRVARHWGRGSVSQARERADPWFVACFSGASTRSPDSLGGERQRDIARAPSIGPGVIIVDEPTSA